MTYDIQAIELEPVKTAVVRGRVPVDDISTWLPAAYNEVFRVLAQQSIAPTGPPFARYVLGSGTFDIEAGAPVASPVRVEGRVEPGDLPGGRAATTTHIGPYDALGDAVAALTSWIRSQGAEPAGAHWEIYYSDPVLEPDPSRFHTAVVMPLQPVTEPVA